MTVATKKNLHYYAGLISNIEREEFIAGTDHPFLVGREILAQEISNHLDLTAESGHSILSDVATGEQWNISQWVIELKEKDGSSRPGRILVGRNQENDIVVPHSTVSGEHGYFSRDAYIVNRWFVVDAGASNGIRVNGLKVSPHSRTPIIDGDSICFGECAFHWHTPGGFYDQVRAIFD